MDPLHTVSRERYSLVETTVNALAGVLHRLNMPITSLEGSSIRRKAEKMTGCSDWGHPNHAEALDRLLRLISRKEFTALSHVVTRQAMLKAAANRLKLVQYLKDNEAVLRSPMGRPVFVLGFPRTGTTLLQNLLCLDAGRRSLPFWELTQPVPVSPDPETDRVERMRSAEKVLSLAYSLAPEMRKIHEIKADTPEECWYLFSYCFTVLNYDFQAGVGEFGDWLLTQDLIWAYQSYQKQLTVLNHHNPAEHLVLKCPEHLWFLDTLLEVFPDACIVWTHRDPVASIASYSSLISLTYRMHFGEMTPRRIGTHIQKRFHQGVTRAMRARDVHNDEATFFDVRFHELVQDPGAMVARITDHFGLRSVQPAAVEGWLSGDRKDQPGAHRYSAERYGLDRHQVHAQFQTYIDRFGIQVKSDQATCL